MIWDWFSFIIEIPGEIITYLDSLSIYQNVTILKLIVAAAIAGIITSTFLAVARR